MINLLLKMLGNPNDKKVKKMMPIVEHINKLEPEMEKLSDEELAQSRANWQPKEPTPVTGYLARYREMVPRGNRGAVLEIPRN